MSLIILKISFVLDRQLVLDNKLCCDHVHTSCFWPTCSVAISVFFIKSNWVAYAPCIFCSPISFKLHDKHQTFVSKLPYYSLATCWFVKISNHNGNIRHSSCSANLPLHHWYVLLCKTVTSHLVTIIGNTAFQCNRTALTTVVFETKNQQIIFS